MQPLDFRMVAYVIGGWAMLSIIFIGVWSWLMEWARRRRARQRRW